MNNELDNPTQLNVPPKTTEEVMANIPGIPGPNERKREYLKTQLTKLEAEAWEHDDTADYTAETMLPPITQTINQNRIAIARHEEIIQEIENSGSHTREDRERKKASEADIKLLQQENKERNTLQANIEKIINGRKAKADEVRLHMKFLADHHKHLFEGYKPEGE